MDKTERIYVNDFVAPSYINNIRRRNLFYEYKIDFTLRMEDSTPSRKLTSSAR